ncbi:MAG: GlsB/YeaQ/YmgE family stress response membrane protein [Rhodobacter sp.]|uniref:GlsB/YeaQ/YmgE family stress response membrane protein n=1 Tax=Pararhodobacter sp. TaxID=2127056 RepID=UPI001D9DAD61|nr:GlsB/YeaQ/YmgE family stress response membrane protein [Pararhodobacter sp.]MCB1344949.1 GlsB/YeaQ/YmgE family stress response membrane protein [Paracoccaceae bacterium]MCC0072015.1 GlsB/YeaQ/YmgE family stress response membrane protein [Rhodobacter sp.]HPD94135.1 GlsB/YeaQ/YmgE family stress response membrane protein [Pararhodobacter sp.]
MGMGWIGAIVVGGLAGWIASQVMKSNTGILVNIVLGIVGAAVASWLFGFLGVAFSGILGYLIAGFLGGSILIWIGRKVF